MELHRRWSLRNVEIVLSRGKDIQRVGGCLVWINVSVWEAPENELDRRLLGEMIENLLKEVSGKCEEPVKC